MFLIWSDYQQYNVTCIAKVCKLINNVTENQRDNQDWTIQQHWQHWVHKTQEEDKQNKKHNTICVGHQYTQTQKHVYKP